MFKRIRYLVTETLLWLLAGAGLIAILLVIGAYTFNTSVILFRTGSMEPTVPTGSAALVREIPASEVEVGDILTVERPDRLPVTHRVIDIEAGETPEERVVTMQGDANDYPDASPYTITEGKVLLGSIPGMAGIINQLGNPYVLGGITIAAALLVGWAFWPRHESPSKPEARNAPDSTREPAQKAASSFPSQHHSWTMIAVLTATTAVTVPSTAPASENNLVEETIQSQYITLTSVYDPAAREALTPNTSSVWDIGIDIHAPSQGQGRIGIQSQGDFPLLVTVLACSKRWDDLPSSATQDTDACSAGSRTLIANQIVSSNDDLRWIDDFETADAPWLRLFVSLPSDETEQSTGTAGLRVDVEAAGDEISTDTAVTPGAASIPAAPTSPEQGLARTGTSALFLLLVAVACMALGRWLHARRLQKDHG